MSVLRDRGGRPARGGPGPRRTAPRMLPGEVEDLVIHVLRCRPLYPEAKRWVVPEHFERGDEAHFMVAVREYLGLAARRYPGDSEEERKVGLLWHAYKVVRDEDLDPRLGIDLLRRFLMKRAAYDRATAILEKGKGGPGEAFADVMETTLSLTRRIEAIGAAPARTLGEEWAEHTRRLEAHRGRRLIGLQTGLGTLDERTLGLRGLTVLGAMPNVGKTALATQLAVGVCRHHAHNDAVTVVVSLDMDRWELYRRVHCHLARVDWATLVFGSPELRGRPAVPYFNPGHEMCLWDADRLRAEYQLDRRLVIYDRETIGPAVTADRLVALLADAKERAGATRALLVIDYLQLLDVPERLAERGDELEAAKHRVLTVQEVVRATRTVSNPQGDAVLAISEARTPADAKTGWGSRLADLMGSSRLAYAADAVLLYRRMDAKDVGKYYGITGPAPGDQALQCLERLEGGGVAPVVLTLAKARDGMTRGEFGLEFEFRMSSFRSVGAPAADGARAGDGGRPR